MINMGFNGFSEERKSTKPEAGDPLALKHRQAVLSANLPNLPRTHWHRWLDQPPTKPGQGKGNPANCKEAKKAKFIDPPAA